MIQANGNVYEGDWKDDLLNDLPNVKVKFYEDGNIYEGEWKDGQRNGNGKEVFSNGNVYEGDFKDNLPNGKGKQIFANGNNYECDFKDGQRIGKGKMIQANGDIYEGDWKDDLPNGKGKMTFKDGDVYEGDFKDGNRIGNGKQSFLNGDVYEGDFKDGMPDGKGKWTYLESEIDAYEGEFKNSRYHGKGQITFAADKGSATGDFYEGFCEDPKYYNKYGKRIESRGPIGKMTEANVTSMINSSELLIDEDTRKRKAEKMLSPKDQRKFNRNNRPPPKINPCKECDSGKQCFPPVEKRGSDYADHKKFVAAEKAFYKKHPLRKIKDKK